MGFLFMILLITPAFAQNEEQDATWVFYNIPVWLLVVSIISVGTGIFVGFVSWRYQRKNLEFNALTRVFDILGNEEHRRARECVINAFLKYVDENESNLELFKVIENKIEIVRTDYDQIGVLIYKHIDEDNLGDKNQDRGFFHTRKGYLPKEDFFEAYAGSVINNWCALEHFIESQKGTKFSDKRFVVFFNHLYIDAKRFQEKKGESNVQRKYRENSDKLSKWLKQIQDKKNDS